jgi:peptidoglycan hydrolase FlgJ
MVDPVALGTVARTVDSPKKIEGAAKQFEALLLGQMLRSIRDSEDDPTNSTMLDVADQQFAQMLANNGGIGLARLIVKGLGQPRMDTDAHE